MPKSDRTPKHVAILYSVQDKIEAALDEIRSHRTPPEHLVTAFQLLHANWSAINDMLSARNF